MPEGDNIWQAAAALHQALAGRPIVRSDLRVPRYATVDLRGRTITEVVPRGKHLLIRMDGLTLHSHLMMDGSWKIFETGEPWHGGPTHQIRAILETEQATAVAYRVHDFKLVPTDREHLIVGHLGPDLLGPDWDAELAVHNLLKLPERPIAEALLDQRNLAGIGNVYKAEILFLERVNPWDKTKAVDLPPLVATAYRLLTANRESPRRNTTGSPREPAWVYGRAGRPCLRCGNRITSTEQGVPPRRTYWCPNCQRTST